MNKIYYTKQRQGRLAFRNAVRIHVDSFTTVKRLVTDEQLEELDILTRANMLFPCKINSQMLQAFKTNLI